MINNPTAYLHLEKVCKRFPSVQALQDITLDLPDTKVHAILGENGAGKSTLLKILSGALNPTSGYIQINSRKMQFRSTSDAIGAGIAVIHQELNLVPNMRVDENLFLGHMPSRFGFVNKNVLSQLAKAKLAELNENISEGTKIHSLSIASRQMIEIAKALLLNAKIIAFDEPTSSLTGKEVASLFSVIRDLRKKNHCVLYVSHRLEEIFEICDTVSIFRDGHLVESCKPIGEISKEYIVSKMVGRAIQDVYGFYPRPKDKSILEVKNLTGPGLKTPANFHVNKGEILGFFGLVGAGRTELMKLLYGATKITSGCIIIDENEEHIHSPKQAIKAGIALCPEDRKLEAIIPLSSVAENINLSIRRLFSYLGFFLSGKKEIQNAQALATRLNIRTPTLDQKLIKLSGGNQQKVILARWLSEKIKILILDEPTRGIDVGTKSEIYSILYELSAKGLALIIVSSDLPEILGICDRIIVMREGSIVSSLHREEANQNVLLQLALPQQVSLHTT